MKEIRIKQLFREKRSDDVRHIFMLIISLILELEQ